MRDQQLAIIFLNKLDKKKYGAMLEDWDNRLNDGEDVYPKTLNEAFRRVSNRKMDPRNMHVAGQGVAFVAQESGKQSTGNTLPYRLPNIMVVHLVYHCVRAINLFPRTGLSQSPKELFTGVKADFKRDFRLQFGSSDPMCRCMRTIASPTP